VSDFIRPAIFSLCDHAAGVRRASGFVLVAKGLVIDLMTGFRIVGGLRGIRKLSVYQPRAPEVLLYRPILR